MRSLQPLTDRSCPLCGAANNSIIKNLCYALFDESPLSKVYDLVSCNQCGFVFCQTESTAADFYAHYARNMHYLAENCGTGAPAEKENRRYAAALSILQKYQPDKEAKIVDIGSAKGGFVSFLNSKGYENLLAIDLLPECVDFIKARGIEANIGSAEKMPMANSSVHSIILSHVLEHIVDLQAVMAELNRVIEESGLVYAEVPTIEYGSSFESAPMWDFLYEHINYFSMQHLVSLFESRRFICLESNVSEIRNGNGVVKCVSAIFKKDERAPAKNISNFDMKTKVFDIIETFGNLEFTELIKIKEAKRPCYIWGISAYMQWLIANTPIGGCNIISFVDKSEFKQMKTINKTPVKSTELLANLPSEAVVIFPSAPDGDSMNQYLDEVNFAGKRIIV